MGTKLRMEISHRGPNPEISSGSFAVLKLGLGPGHGPSKVMETCHVPIILLGGGRKVGTPPTYSPPTSAPHGPLGRKEVG